MENPGWCFSEREGCTIKIGECKDSIARADLGDHAYFAYLEVEGLDHLHQAFLSKGATLWKPPENNPWGMREFPLLIIDGDRLLFGQKT